MRACLWPFSIAILLFLLLTGGSLADPVDAYLPVTPPPALVPVPTPAPAPEAQTDFPTNATFSAPAPPPQPPPPEPETAEPVADADGEDAGGKYSRLFNRIMELVHQDYVDADKATYQKLVYAALAGMLTSLDPHSQFLDQEDFSFMERDTHGFFTGFGLILGLDKNNAMVVVAVLEDTPAARAGILPGDHVLRINGTSTQKVPFSTAIKALRGKVGDKVRITLYRPQSVPAPRPGLPAKTGHEFPETALNIFEVTLTRIAIRVTSVKEAKVLPSDAPGEPLIGYIRIEQFSEDTADAFAKALDELGKQQISALVLDLRNDPGGLLQPAIDIAGAFLPDDTLVFSTEGRTPESRHHFTTHATRPPVSYPLAVLINGYTASGPEIVAGALQDLHRAIIVGQTTFGKGSMQSVISLGNGLGVRLSTARYYTPHHHLINDNGISPDIYVPFSAAEDRALFMLHSPDRLTEEEKTDLKDFRDTQLERAVAALRGVLLHGERSIPERPAPSPRKPSAVPAPDVVVPVVPYPELPLPIPVATAVSPPPIPPAPVPEMVLPAQPVPADSAAPRAAEASTNVPIPPAPVPSIQIAPPAAQALPAVPAPAAPAPAEPTPTAPAAPDASVPTPPTARAVPDSP